MSSPLVCRTVVLRNVGGARDGNSQGCLLYWRGDSLGSNAKRTHSCCRIRRRGHAKQCNLRNMCYQICSNACSALKSDPAGECTEVASVFNEMPLQQNKHSAITPASSHCPFPILQPLQVQSQQMHQGHVHEATHSFSPSLCFCFVGLVHFFTTRMPSYKAGEEVVLFRTE